MLKPSPRYHAGRTAGPQRLAAELAYTPSLLGSLHAGLVLLQGRGEGCRQVQRVTAVPAAGRQQRWAAAGAHAQLPPSEAP